MIADSWDSEAHLRNPLALSILPQCKVVLWGEEMTRVEERGGFEILLEEPPSAKSLWAALIKTGGSILIDKASASVHVCLSCSRDGALADARAFIDKVASDRPHIVASEDG
jgi:hypothetical protein